MKAWVANSENISLSLFYQGLSVVTVSCPTPAYNSTYCTLLSGRILADRVTLQVDISLTKGYLAVWDVAVSGTSETPGEHFLRGQGGSPGSTSWKMSLGTCLIEGVMAVI